MERPELHIDIATRWLDRVDGFPVVIIDGTPTAPALGGGR